MRVQLRLCRVLARPKSRRLKVHVHVRVGRRARRVFALFPSDSTFVSHRWQFARSFQKVFVKNTTTVFFFSTTEAEKARVNLSNFRFQILFEFALIGNII